MSTQIQGDYQGTNMRVAIIAARFNEFISQRLLNGALEALTRQGINEQDTIIIWVPGSFELPVAARALAKLNHWDAIVCLGAVVRGQTTHHEHVGREATTGIAAAARETGIPITLGVLTTENMEQAVERSGGRLGNRGTDAALAAIEMVNLLRQIKTT